MKTQKSIILLALIFVLFSCEKNTAPTCEITSPADNAVVIKGETVTISVEANDADDNLKEVRFYIDNAGVGSASSFPFSYTWNTTNANEGSHTIKATAIDEDGEESSDNISVVLGAEPGAAFTANQTNVETGTNINFTDQSTGDPIAWNWDFGDGTTSTDQNSSHIYNNAGTYTIELSVENDYGSDTETKTNYITVSEAGSAPIAAFTANQTTITEGETVSFTDQSVNSPTSWNWSFGDGSTSTSQNPSHTYNSNGTYTVVLTVTNDFGSDTETKTGYIIVNQAGIAPVAAFTANQTSITEGETVSFTDQSTNTPTSWSWGFGDGSTSTSEDPTHVYSSVGTYTVELTVTNSYGSDIETKTNYITVTEAGTAPVAAFTANQTSITEGETVSFTDQSTNTPTSWSWGFGDGSTSTSEDPTHVYSSAGIYTVVLTVTNSYGLDTETKTDYITVTTGGTGANDVQNPTTGQIWMDRNLGASQVATSSTDAAAYGDLYQWGRAADEHESRTSGTTTTLSTTDSPGHSDFITINSSLYDWRSPQNDNLWQGVNGTNNPCPSGYRLPTEAEWEAELTSWSSNNADGAFASSLKLPVAGSRSYSSGSLLNVGSSGHYWLSTVDGNRSRDLNFYSSNVYMYSNNRANGYSVRCLKD